MIIHWHLGHIARSGRLIQEPYIVVKDHMVFDTDSQGWDLGIRSGMAVKEIKWHYPQAQWIPWRSQDYQETFNRLSVWLEQHTLSYWLEEVGKGYWQQPDMDCDEWRQVIKEFIPQRALRIQMGISENSLLSRWISVYGDRYPEWTERWQDNAQIAYVLPRKNTNKMWEELPLTWLSHLPVRTVQEWKKRGWERVGDVPHFRQIVEDQQKQSSWMLHKSGEPICVKRSFEEPLQQGFYDLVRFLATEIGEVLQKNQQGSRYLRIIWQNDKDTVVYERKWPLPTRSIRQVVTRFLSLILTIPSVDLVQLTLEAHQPEILTMDQLMWWGSTLARPSDMVSGLSTISRRAQLLQYWDPWRRQTDWKTQRSEQPQASQRILGQ
ncbi:MAG: hypothetical protein M1294_16315 [Firmicutes bacterium]|jgi:hypothetical protein|nr:hypothetical protein [Bacillota bacterium]MCL5014484.1 hypothetical protein [Bacillota bacterium]